MSKLTPSLSRVLKPYHTHELQYEEAPPTLDADGFLAFSPGDVENPKTWSRARRWWVSFAAVLMVVNATFASSTPSGVLQVWFIRKKGRGRVAGQESLVVSKKLDRG